MYHKKAARLISFILIIIFAFQFTLLVTPSFEGGDCHTQNLELIKFVNNVQIHTVAFNQKNLKFTFQSSNTKFQGFSNLQVYYNNYLIQYFNRNGIIFNFKDKIVSVISQYFHGSKYKDYHLAI